MDLLIYAVGGLAATWLLFRLYVLVATRAVEGRSADPLYSIFPELAVAEGKVLVYCFSPKCGPCRPMSREVDSLAEAGAPVFKFDITEDLRLARELGIRATPTLILVEHGRIVRMLIGVKTADYMRQLMTATAP